MEKAPGIDKINDEMIKYGGEPLIKKLTEIQTYNGVLYCAKILPRDWKKCEIILIFKKETNTKYKTIVLLAWVKQQQKNFRVSPLYIRSGETLKPPVPKFLEISKIIL